MGMDGIGGNNSIGDTIGFGIGEEGFVAAAAMEEPEVLAFIEQLTEGLE